MKTHPIISLLLILAGCGGGQGPGATEPDPVEPPPLPPDKSHVVPEDPAGAEIVGPTHGLDASCEKDDDCIVTTSSGGCDCCGCEVLLVSSKKSYGWLMDEYAKEQCDDALCATVDCEPCPPEPEPGPAVCHEGTCGMITP